MKIIIGLGNPGTQYENTRHNAGFLCIDYLAKEWGFDAFHEDKKSSALITSGMVEEEKILLVKPLTFMNDSGTAIHALLQFYKLSPHDIALIHDDLDIAPGTYRTTLSSRAAGHNGVQDIIETLGTQDFFRVRLGIGRPTPVEEGGACMSSHDFVLQKFSEDELLHLTALFPRVKDELKQRLSQ